VTGYQDPLSPRTGPRHYGAPAQEPGLDQTAAFEDPGLTQALDRTALDATMPVWHRFGPGVPAATHDVGARRPPEDSGGVPGPRRSGKHGRQALVSFVSVLAVAAGVALWDRLQRTPSVHVLSAGIDPIASAAVRCDATVDVVGVLTTDGHPGTVAYRWRRDGGDPGPVEHQSVAAGARQTEVHLAWEFTGHGTHDATVSLEVVQTPAVTATSSFVYHC
jgi:hypothetical protein